MSILSYFVLQDSIQINPIPHVLTIWNQIMDQSGIVPVKRSCASMSVWPCDSPVVRQQGTTLRGVGSRAGVCVCVRACGGNIHYTIRGSRRIGYVGFCVWMRSWSAKQELQPHRNLTSTHGVYTQTATHSAWVSMATPNKQSVHAVTPPPAREREKPRQRSKNRH